MGIGLRNWSTTTANNASLTGSADAINWKEGQAPSTVNNSARETLSQIRSGFEDIADGWFDYGDPPGTRNGAEFSLTGTHSVTYAVGRRLRMRGGTVGTVYGVITSNSISGGNSIIGVEFTPSISLSGTLSEVALGIRNARSDDLIYLPDGSVSAPSLTNVDDTNSGIAFLAADTVSVTTGGEEKWRFNSNELAGENLIINGDLLVVQRGVSFTGVAPADGDYSLDRWLSIGGGGTPADRYTVSQVAATAGALLAGFAKAIRAETTTAETSPHVDRYSAPISQRVELQTALRLGYGASGAKPLTVSFWVRSSQTGTHGIAIAMSNGAHSNPQSYSVSSADTWEKKSVTFAGNTSAAIALNYGLQLFFLTQLGTTADNGTQNTWGNYLGYTAIADIAGATSRYLEITGVQMTAGSAAGDFEFEDYSTTLAKCQRYYYTGGSGVNGGYSATTKAIFGFQFPQIMRTAPTAALLDTSIATFDTARAGLTSSSGSITYSNIKKEGAIVEVDGFTSCTQHRPLIVYNQEPFISFTAEL